MKVNAQNVLFLFIFINFTDFHELLRIKYREGGVFKRKKRRNHTKEIYDISN